MVLGSFAALEARTARELAADRYKRAQTLLEDLRAVPQVELGERQYLLVIDALKSVHRASPASSYCDDALLGVGDVYVAMIDRFGPEPWRGKAVQAYRYVIREYPHSRLLGKARAAIGELEGGRLPELSEPRAEPAPPPAPERPQPPAPAPTPPAETIVRQVSTAPTTTTPANRVAEAPPRMRAGVATVSSVRHYSHPGYTRIVVDADDYVPYKFDFLSRPHRLYFDLMSARMTQDIRKGVTIEVNDPQVARIRAAQNRADKARVVLDLNTRVFYDIQWIANPPRLVIDLRSEAPAQPALTKAEPTPVERAAPAETPTAPPPEPQSFAEAFRELTAERQPQRPGPRAVERIEGPAPTAPETRGATLTASALPRVASEALPPPPPSQPKRTTMTKAAPPPAPSPNLPKNLPAPKPAQATSRGGQGLIRALGLKIGRVVIDAGHGGHDTGMIGPTGLREKDVVLDVSLRLGKLIEDRLGAEVVYTREDDRFLDLRSRPQVANRAKADLFVSVHANAYASASVRGVETFYLNLTADPWALKVASRENAAATHSVHELQDLLGKIAQKEKIEESREFAQRMQSAIYSGLSKETKGLRNRGVRQAPLLVLIGAKMPAILTEIGFLSNPTDEKLFKSGKYRDTVAEQLFSGIESYMKTLSSHTLTMTDQETASASLD